MYYKTRIGFLRLNFFHFYNLLIMLTLSHTNWWNLYQILVLRNIEYEDELLLNDAHISHCFLQFQSHLTSNELHLSKVLQGSSQSVNSQDYYRLSKFWYFLGDRDSTLSESAFFNFFKGAWLNLELQYVIFMKFPN